MEFLLGTLIKPASASGAVWLATHLTARKNSKTVSICSLASSYCSCPRRGPPWRQRSPRAPRRGGPRSAAGHAVAAIESVYCDERKEEKM